MNDLHDLLVRHADSVADEHRDLRLDEVRARVRTARRRRQAVRSGVVACVVLAVALGAAVLPRLRPPDATPAELVGHRVPETTTSLGYVYRYADSAVGDDGGVSLDLEASTKPRLLRWASEKPGGTLELQALDDGDPWVTKAGDFGTFAYVPPGGAMRVVLGQHGVNDPGQVALAVYTLSKAAPGVSGGGVTFRESMGSADLVDARIGLPGETSVDLSLAGVTGDVRIYAFCKGPDDLSFTVTGLGNRGSCHPSVPVDTGTDTTYTAKAEKVVGMRLQVRDAQGSIVRSRTGVRVGLAVYTDPAPNQVVEDGGHTWVIAHTATAPRGQRTYSSRVGGTGRPARYLVQYVLPPSKGEISIRYSGKFQAGFSSQGNQGTFAREVQAPNTMTVHYAQGPDGRIVIRTYELADRP